MLERVIRLKRSIMKKLRINAKHEARKIKSNNFTRNNRERSKIVVVILKIYQLFIIFGAQIIFQGPNSKVS